MLHAFQGTTAGLWPYWGVTLDAAGSLYGVTATGGAHCDCGITLAILGQLLFAQPHKTFQMHRNR